MPSPQREQGPIAAPQRTLVKSAFILPFQIPVLAVVVSVHVAREAIRSNSTLT